MNINFICYNFLKLKEEKDSDNFQKKLLKIFKNYIDKNKLSSLTKKSFRELISSIKCIFEKILIFKNFQILTEIKDFMNEFFKTGGNLKIFANYEIYLVLNNYNSLLLKTDLNKNEMNFQINQMRIYKSFSKNLNQKYFYGLITNVIVEYYLNLKMYKNAVFEIKKSLKFYQKNSFFKEIINEKMIKECKTVFFVNKVYLLICLKNLNFEKQFIQNEKKTILNFFHSNFRDDINLKKWFEKIIGLKKKKNKNLKIEKKNLINKSTYNMIKFKIKKKLTKSGNFSIKQNQNAYSLKANKNKNKKSIYSFYENKQKLKTKNFMIKKKNENSKKKNKLNKLFEKNNRDNNYIFEKEKIDLNNFQSLGRIKKNRFSKNKIFQEDFENKLKKHEKENFLFSDNESSEKNDIKGFTKKKNTKSEIVYKLKYILDSEKAVINDLKMKNKKLKNKKDIKKSFEIEKDNDDIFSETEKISDISKNKRKIENVFKGFTFKKNNFKNLKKKKNSENKFKEENSEKIDYPIKNEKIIQSDDISEKIVITNFCLKNENTLKSDFSEKIKKSEKNTLTIKSSSNINESIKTNSEKNQNSEISQKFEKIKESENLKKTDINFEQILKNINKKQNLQKHQKIFEKVCKIENRIFTYKIYYKIKNFKIDILENDQKIFTKQIKINELDKIFSNFMIKKLLPPFLKSSKIENFYIFFEYILFKLFYLKIEKEEINVIFNTFPISIFEDIIITIENKNYLFLFIHQNFSYFKILLFEIDTENEIKNTIIIDIFLDRKDFKNFFEILVTDKKENKNFKKIDNIFVKIKKKNDFLNYLTLIISDIFNLIESEKYLDFYFLKINSLQNKDYQFFKIQKKNPKEIFINFFKPNFCCLKNLYKISEIEKNLNLPENSIKDNNFKMIYFFIILLIDYKKKPILNLKKSFLKRECYGKKSISYFFQKSKENFS